MFFNSVSFWNTITMTAYLFAYLMKLTCCLNKDKLNQFKKVEKKFNNRLNVEDIIPSIVLNEKLNSLLFSEDQLQNVVSCL